MAKNDKPARRSGPSPAMKKLEKGKQALQNRLKNIKSREMDMRNKGAAGVAGYLSADWWAKREAVEDRGGKPAAFKFGKTELDGTKVGAGVAIAGILGVAGDDLYNDVLFGAGFGIVTAKKAVETYKKKLAEPPKAGEE